MRELKQLLVVINAPFPSRTPPGVRELKRTAPSSLSVTRSRTPPGVRELKLAGKDASKGNFSVAPLPGCVN